MKYCHGHIRTEPHHFSSSLPTNRGRPVELLATLLHSGRKNLEIPPPPPARFLNASFQVPLLCDCSEYWLSDRVWNEAIFINLVIFADIKDRLSC